MSDKVWNGPTNDAYRKGWNKIFGKEDSEEVDEESEDNLEEDSIKK